MEFDSNALDFQKLKGSTNYREWKVDVEMLLRDKGLFGIVDGVEATPPATATAEIRNAFSRRADKALSIIYRALDQTIKPLIVNIKDPVDAWQKLKDTYEPSCKALIGRLLTEFYNAKMTEGETISVYLARLSDLKHQLKNSNCEIADTHYAYKMISNLPERFNLIVQQLYQLDDESFTPVKITQSLLAEEGRVLNQSSLGSNLASSSCLNVTKQKPTSVKNFQGVQCYNCGRYGHVYRLCRFPKKRYNVKPKFNVRSHVTESSFLDYSEECSDSTSFSELLNVSVEDSIFLFDSGASNHFCFERNLFVNFTETRKIVKQGKGELKATGVGEIPIYLKGENGFAKVTLSNVLFVPDLNKNLISLGVIEGKGFSYCGMNGYLSIFNQNNKLILKVRNQKCLYPVIAIQPNKFECNTNFVNSVDVKSLDLWHRRCAHINAGNVYQTINYNLVSGVHKVDKEKIICHECILGKLKRGPFKRIKKVTTNRPLELLHTDLWGPSPVDSHSGCKYFLGIVDDYSRWLTTVPLKNKSDAPNAILNYISSAERQLGVKVVNIRSDNGLEFCNQYLDSKLKSLGIKHQLSNRYSPEMMGVAEKVNGDAMDAVRTLLADSKLDAKFWAEALCTYTHVKNRIRHSVSPNATPHQRYYNAKPDISHFRVFGSLCFSHVPKVYRNKLQNKSSKGILIGYAFNTKGYRVYDPITNKVTETGHVKIDESILGIDEFKRKSCKTVTFNDDDSSDSEFPDDDFDRGTVKIPDVKCEPPDVKVPPVQIPAPIVPDPTICSISGWTRKEVPRKTSSRIDVYYYAPDNTRCRSTTDVQKCCAKLGISVNLDSFNFKPIGTHLEPNQNSDTQSDDEIEYLACFVHVPSSYDEVIISDFRQKWEESMDDEIKAIEKRDVWEIIPKPKDCKPITSRWVYSLKTNVDGTVKRFKSRLVAHGHKQKYLVNFTSTFSPVIDFSLVKLFFVLLVCVCGYKHMHCDVKNAYLNSELTESIFMKFPKGFNLPSNIDQSKCILRLKKSLYGLKQSGRNWYFHVTQTLENLGFIRSKYCPCLFRLNDECLILLYVDDFAIFAKTDESLNEVFCNLSKSYEIVNLGPIENFLGVQFQNVEGSVYMHQHAYIDKLLEKFKIDPSVNVTTPMDVGSSYDPSIDDCKHDLPFKELLGSLLFLANRTRADILFPVIYVAQFSSKFNVNHYNLLLRILKYVSSTKAYAINLSKAKNSDFKMYSDASWATAFDSRRSISGYIWSLGNVFLGWRSCIQKCISKSTMESEVVALDTAATESVWIYNIMNEHSNFLISYHKPVLFCDNQAAIAFSENVIVNNRTKHIDVRYCFVRDLIERRFININYVRSNLSTLR